MIFRFRVILDNDTQNDVFRDLEIKETDTMEELHDIINQSFGFDDMEMASFYLSNDNWEQGEEITFFGVDDEGQSKVKVMRDVLIRDVVNEDSPKLIYVYDFLNMWTFFVELADIVAVKIGVNYPNLVYVHGQIPEQAPEKQFETEDELVNEFENELETEDYNNLDFEENWN